jgi:hypothetical protein
MFGQKRLARTTGGFLLVGTLLLISLAACGTGGNAGGTAGNTSTASGASGNIVTPTPGQATVTPTATPTTLARPTGTALEVLSVAMAVSPKSLSSYSCGATVTVTYTATFHFPASNAGGQVAFTYTTNNGRSATQAGLTVQPGQTSVPYQFKWSGALPTDHTMPEPGGVMVTAPNALTSTMLGPSGNCASTPFTVTSVDIVASPTVTGQTCGSQFTETYTATFHIAANSPGGTIVFTYTVNNGHSSSQAISLTAAAGQTTKTYKFYWKGTLPADHTAPGIGIVLVTSPNAVTSTGGTPTGQCS